MRAAPGRGGRLPSHHSICDPLRAGAPFTRRAQATAHIALPQPRQGHRLSRCGLWAALAFRMGPGTAETKMGPCPQGKTPQRNSQCTGGRVGEGGSSRQALASSFPRQAPRLPTVMDGGTPNLSLPPPPSCGARAWPDCSRASSALHTAVGAEHTRGTPTSPQSACSRVCPALGCVQFPPH